MRKIGIKPDMLLSPSGIVKASLMARFFAAERIEIDARIRADEEARTMRESIELERMAARQAGHASGLHAFEAAVRQVDRTRKQLCERIETLLRECLERILGSMPKEELLSATLAAVLGDLRRPLDVVVRVHPEVVPALEIALAVYRNRQGNQPLIRAEPDPQMKLEECLVYAGSYVIDVSIPVMIEEMLGGLTLSSLEDNIHVT